MANIEYLVQAVGKALTQRAFKLATAESCTGGGISYWITSVPGSSAWFEGGFVTYSHAAKMAMLGVREDTLRAFGSVSEQTVREMAEGALQKSDATVSIAITGIAGPEGGTVMKPVGTVWIGYAGKQLPTKTLVKVFSGERQAVRDQTIVTALENFLTFLP